MSNKKPSELFRTIAWGILAITLAIVAISIPYALSVRGDIWDLFKLSKSNSDWGAYGSYIGGVLGPVLSAASILFVWWQSKEGTANQQAQLTKLNEQLGLEKQNTFRDEFIRLLGRAEQQAELQVLASPGSGAFDIASGPPIKKPDGILLYKVTYSELSLSRKKTFLIDDDWNCLGEKFPDSDRKKMDIAWRMLKPYMLHVFELADFLQNQSENYLLDEHFLTPFKRQFRDIFYPLDKEDDAWIKWFMDDETLHSYKNLSEILER